MINYLHTSTCNISFTSHSITYQRVELESCLQFDGGPFLPCFRGGRNVTELENYIVSN